MALGIFTDPETGSVVVVGRGALIHEGGGVYLLLAPSDGGLAAALARLGWPDAADVPGGVQTWTARPGEPAGGEPVEVPAAQANSKGMLVARVETKRRPAPAPLDTNAVAKLIGEETAKQVAALQADVAARNAEREAARRSSAPGTIIRPAGWTT